jgi:hypothetical protein
MGNVKRHPAIVVRSYRHSSDHMERAVEMLLKSKTAAQPREPNAPNVTESRRSGHAGVGDG